MTDEPSINNNHDKFIKSKAFKDAQKLLYKRLYFNKKFRDGIRKDFLKLQEKGLNIIENAPLTTDIQSLKNRSLAEKMLDVSAKYLEGCDKADKMAKKRILTKRKFKLLKKINGKKVVFDCNFYKPYEKKYKFGCLIFPEGISKKRIKCYLIREKNSEKGFVLADKGTFNQKIRSFEEVDYIFRGKKNYKFKCFKMKKPSKGFWAEKLSTNLKN